MASHLAKLERDIDRLLASSRRPAGAASAMPPLQRQTLLPRPQPAPAPEAPGIAAAARDSPLLRGWSPGADNEAEALAEPQLPAVATSLSMTSEASTTGNLMPAAEAATAAVAAATIPSLPTTATAARRPTSSRRWQPPSQEVEALLGEELGEERNRRLRAESAARTLLNQLEQEKRRSAAGDHRYGWGVDDEQPKVMPHNTLPHPL